jgi:hypothetical protein
VKFGCYVHIADAVRICLTIHRSLAAAQQSLPESAAAQEIPVLLASNPTLIFQFVEDSRTQRVVLGVETHIDDVRFGQVLEPVGRSMFDELIEIDRMIDRAQVVVEKGGIGVFVGSLNFSPEELTEDLGFLLGFGQKPQQGASL